MDFFVKPLLVGLFILFLPENKVDYMKNSIV